MYPCREVRDSQYESTKPPPEIPAYGPDADIVSTKDASIGIVKIMLPLADSEGWTEGGGA